MTKLGVVACVLALAVHTEARADCLAADAATKRLADIDGQNAKARDAALTASGLKHLPLTPIARGLQSTKPTGNTMMFKIQQGCNDDGSSEPTFATDKAGDVYRLTPKLTYVEATLERCGADPCPPPCGMPPSEITLWYRFPDKAKFKGEREVGWKITMPRTSYQQACGKNGAVTPKTASTTTATTATTPAAPPPKPVKKMSRGQLEAEVEKLRIELAQLQRANERHKREDEEVRRRLQQQLEQLSTKIKE
jgi:hypothetical protein